MERTAIDGEVANDSKLSWFCGIFLGRVATAVRVPCQDGGVTTRLS